MAATEPKTEPTLQRSSANSAASRSTSYTIVVVMDACRINFCKTAVVTRLAHRVPKLRRRSCAEANLTFPLFAWVWILTPANSPIREIYDRPWPRPPGCRWAAGPEHRAGTLGLWGAKEVPGEIARDGA